MSKGRLHEQDLLVPPAEALQHLYWSLGGGGGEDPSCLELRGVWEGHCLCLVFSKA